LDVPGQPGITCCLGLHRQRNRTQGFAVQGFSKVFFMVFSAFIGFGVFSWLWSADKSDHILKKARDVFNDVKKG